MTRFYTYLLNFCSIFKPIIKQGSQRRFSSITFHEKEEKDASSNRIAKGCEGVGSKPLSVHLTVSCIQLSVLPVPLPCASTELFGLAPVRLLVSAGKRQSRPCGFIVHDSPGSLLKQSQPFRTPEVNRVTCMVERGLSSVSYTVSSPPTPSQLYERGRLISNKRIILIKLKG